ncbi:hydrolase [Candidatus Magnetominusculus xianensis]|uniref:Isochorismatase n=1 Tax=Candidatus Magnetominusculus xianensis TaxID=1748249 RepID=A0ABR5SB57_9BACT|nr:hydrolase [Candidatus Magnetominusculus xianensis]KWT76398.1 isochorismatase [Candidatus Magnetominusculus xianensis]MBF0404866.1 hydrolase [Nitrospirota bacterium]
MIEKYSAHDSVILVVDIQERLAAVMSEKDSITANTLHVIELAKLIKIPICLTEQYPKGLGRTIPEISDAIPDFKPFEKMTFSACAEEGFLESFRQYGRNKVILCGIETHICILQTCLGLIAEGYGVHVVSDCVSSRTQTNKAIGIGLMHEAGAVITSTETVVFQMLARAGTDEFKIMSKRIK